MVARKGKSQKARETTKRSIKILLEQIAYVRDQVDEQNVSTLVFKNRDAGHSPIFLPMLQIK